MQARTRELTTFSPLPSLLALPALVVAAAIIGAYAYLRQPASPVAQERAVLAEQLDLYAGWEREHPHECLVPLGGSSAAANTHYQRHAVWFLEDQGAAALLRYRAWFQATYAAQHPGGTRHDRFLSECAPADVLGERAWLDRYLALPTAAP
jgi:hypothetical protein